MTWHETENLFTYTSVNMKGCRIPQTVVFFHTFVLQLVLVGTNLVPGGKRCDKNTFAPHSFRFLYSL